ncbi:MAG: hypothetical protein ACPG5U_03330 [Planktomarina sp.]
MRDFTTNVLPSGQDSVRKFVMNLVLRSEGEPELRACEVMAGKYRNRTSFLRNALMKDVLVDAVAERVAECLEGLDNENQVKSLPDFAIELPGLTLARAHVMVSHSDEDAFHVMIRFGSFLGAANRAFREEIGFDDGSQDEVARVSGLVLSDLVMPVLDICQAAQSGFFEGNQALTSFAEELEKRSQEISFQVELIKRFANQAGEVPAFTQRVEGEDPVVPLPNTWTHPRRLS